MLWILAGSIVAFGSMFLFFRVSGVSLDHGPSGSSPYQFHADAPSGSVVGARPRLRRCRRVRPEPDVVAQFPWFFQAPVGAKNRGQSARFGLEPTAGVSRCHGSGVPPPLLQPCRWMRRCLRQPRKPRRFPRSRTTTNHSECPSRSINPSTASSGRWRIEVSRREPSLPTINSPVPLTPTQVRVGVNPDGLVLYALLDRSGSIQQRRWCGCPSPGHRAAVSLRSGTRQQHAPADMGCLAVSLGDPTAVSDQYRHGGDTALKCPDSGQSFFPVSYSLEDCLRSRRSV